MKKWMERIYGTKVFGASLTLLGLMLALGVVLGSGIRVQADEGQEEVTKYVDVSDLAYQGGGWGVSEAEEYEEYAPEFYGAGATAQEVAIRSKLNELRESSDTTIDIELGSYNLKKDAVTTLFEGIRNEHLKKYYVQPLAEGDFTYATSGGDTTNVTKITVSKVADPADPKEKILNNLQYDLGTENSSVVINLSSYNKTYVEVKALFDQVLTENPKLYYVNNTFTYIEQTITNGSGESVNVVKTITVTSKSAASSAEEKILYALVDMKGLNSTTINLSSYSLSEEQVKTWFAKVLNEHPLLFYVKTGFSCSLIGEKVTSITASASVTSEEITAFENKLKEAAELVESSEVTDPAEKALILHDYLVQHCTYAKPEYESGNLQGVPHVYDAYGALVNGYAVCQGYSLAYGALLNKVGITSYVCSSDTMNHAWNLVNLNGGWYHVDATWDDPTWNVEGQVLHTNFLLSDTAIRATKHSGWSTSITCGTTDYDNAWWKTVTSQIYMVTENYTYDYAYKDTTQTGSPYVEANPRPTEKRTKWYYIKEGTTPESSGDVYKHKFQLVERKIDRGLKKDDKDVIIGNESKEVITPLYTNAVDNFWNIWGETNRFWDGHFSYLSSQGGYLFFNDKTKVYAIKLSEVNTSATPPVTATAVYTYSPSPSLDGYIYGAMVYEDGTIKLSVRQIPNFGDDPDLGEDPVFAKDSYKFVNVLISGLTGWTPATPTYTEPSTITLSPTNLTLSAVGETATLTANVPDGTNKSVIWTSGDRNIATVDSTGKVTAVASGTVMITATALGNRTKKATGTVKVGDGVLKLSSITLNKTTTSLVVGNTDQLTATVAPTNAANTSVNWKSSNTSVATVDSNGKVTAVGAGTAVITASAADGGGASATCTVTVTAIKVTSITLNSKSLYLKEKGTAVLSATVLPTNAPNRNVTWSSSNTAIASVDSNGKVTALAGGVVTITATSVADRSITAACTVTVEALPIKISSITLNKTSATIKIKEALELSVTAIAPSNAANKEYKWASSNPGVASVDSNGKVTGQAAGTAKITATASDGGGAVGVCEVTVLDTKVKTINLQKTLTVKEKETIKLEYTIDPSDAVNQNITWRTDNAKIASVDNTGNVKGIAIGETTITATASDNGGAVATCKVTVVSAKVYATAVKLDKDTLTLDVDKTGQLKATLEPSNVTATTVSWKSNNTPVATVDENGVVTAVAAGKATITASATDGSGRSASCTVTVNPVISTSVKLDQDTMSILIGETGQLKATVGPDKASNKNVKWSSSDEAKATVDEKGKVTAKKVGTVKITATAADGSGKSASCTVTVNALNGWSKSDDTKYWYEDGVRQGVKYNADGTIDKSFRGKEIYDPESDAWFWLDNELEGAIARSKDVYQESLAGDWGDGFNENGERVGKWVRYDADGYMVKGWCAGGADNPVKVKGPEEAYDRPMYYFDKKFGTMAKGFASVDNKEYYFNKDTGVLEREVATVPKNGWKEIDGKRFWYENHARQGYSVNENYRGKEIYDPDSDAWYWLDNVDEGKMAVSKDVYQESLAGDWGDNVNENGERIGKWVRYDADGHMIKGWCAGRDGDAKKIGSPDEAGDRDVYYFDETFGTMAKGECNIDGKTYYFDESTGIMRK